MPKRPQAGSAAAGSDADAKKQKPHVHVCTLTITFPPSTAPESRKLDAQNESIRLARKAEDAATSTLEIKQKEDFELFATPFKAAVASACVKWRRPVTLNEVITAIAETGCKLKIDKRSKERFAWDGFKECRWQISRVQFAGRDPVAYPKDTAMPSKSNSWRFSPSPAARRPLAEGKLSK